MNQTKQRKNETQYFVIYGPFANTYKVYSARHEETVERLHELGAERIGPLQAFGLIEAERQRRHYGQGGYASDRLISGDEMMYAPTYASNSLARIEAEQN